MQEIYNEFANPSIHIKIQSEVPMRVFNLASVVIDPKRPLRTLLLLVSLMLASTAGAQMTDVVYLANGDRITGSVSELNLGEVRVETSTMGWVNIKWEEIIGFVTGKTYQFETARGERFFGSVDRGDDGVLAIKSDDREQLVEMERVIYFTRIKADRSVWEAMDKDMRIGFSFTQGSDVMRWNVGAGLLYKALNYRTSLRFASQVTNNGQGTDSRRADLTGQFQRLLRNRWFWFAETTAETNDELGVNWRLQPKLGGGRYVWQRRSWELMLTAGLAGNLESSPGNAMVQSDEDWSLEGAFGANWTYFRLRTPSSRVNVSLEYLPSISQGGRNRLNFDTTLRQEFIKDMFWVLEFWSTYDSDPPPGAFSGTDYGITTSLEYLW